jgi:hypothetical protein
VHRWRAARRLPSFDATIQPESGNNKKRATPAASEVAVFYKILARNP